MKLQRFGLGLVLAGALTLGCAHFGNTARERALLPALRSAWIGVEEDLDRGINDGMEDGAIDSGTAALLHVDAQALEDGLHASVDEAQAAAIRWPGLDSWAHRGVEDRVNDGENSAGVAESRHERIRQFAAALVELGG